MSTQIVEIACEFKAKTSTQILIKDDRDCEVWLPRSKIDLKEGDIDNLSRDDKIELVVPVWLAEKEGLV
jgi:hypothetical protein